MAIATHLEAAAQVLRELPVPLDRIPYTPEFDNAHRRFQELIPRQVTANECWWSLVDARKRGLGPATRRRRARRD